MVNIRRHIHEKNFVFVSKILIIFAQFVVIMLHFLADITLPEIQMLLLSILMFICAYEQKAKKKEHIMVVWLLIATGIFALIVAFVVIQPFF